MKTLKRYCMYTDVYGISNGMFIVLVGDFFSFANTFLKELAHKITFKEVLYKLFFQNFVCHRYA